MQELYRKYTATIQFRDQVLGGIPKAKDLIEFWLRRKGFSGRKLITIAQKTAVDVQAVEKEILKIHNWTGFKKDCEGLIEERQVKALFKEAAYVLRLSKTPGFRDSISHCVFVKPERIRLSGASRARRSRWICGTPDPRNNTAGAVLSRDQPRSLASRRNDSLEAGKSRSQRIFAHSGQNEVLLDFSFAVRKPLHFLRVVTGIDDTTPSLLEINQEPLNTLLKIVEEELVSMSSRRSRLLDFAAALAFVVLLAFHLSPIYAGTTTHVIAANGDAQIDTAQSKFGGASSLFDGSGDYLSTADSADWYFGSGDFTIDFWVRFNALPANTQLMSFFEQRVDAANAMVFFVYNSAGTYQWYLQSVSGGSYVVNFYKNSPGLAVNTWYHVAYVRSGNSWYVFQNGVQCGTTETDSDALPDVAAQATIGQWNGGSYFNGWLDEYRISKGVARWTSNFSPPSAAYTADSPTVLLLHMNGADGSTTFIDDSAIPGPDFSINASPTSQSIGAGSTASFTLSLNALGGFSGTVSLSVTSGAPPGVTCTIAPSTISAYPGTAILSVPTLITTSGTYSIVVTGTCASPSITHTVTVTLTVSGPASYSFNVKAGATQIVVTLTYSWTGAGAPPLGSITIAGPGGTPTLQESGAVVYDRTSITVSGGTSTYAIIHRATFTITAPGSAQTWTALISLAGVSNYNVAIEVS